MEMYKAYLEEYQPGRSLFHNNDGYATYLIRGEECYLDNIYIVPEKRRTGAGTAITDAVAEIAKEKGCKYLTGTIFTDQNNLDRQTKSMEIFLSYGMKISKAVQDTIWLAKEL